MDSSVLRALFPMATDNSAYFLKLLVCDFSKELKIPPAFNKMLGDDLLKELPKEFVLKTSDGRLWHVGLEMADNLLYFRKGWKEFASDNCLRFGQTLIFMYTGNLEFVLVRFGRNCLLKGFDQDGNKGSGKPLSRKNGKHQQQAFKAKFRSAVRVGVGDEGRAESTMQSDEKQPEGQKIVQIESHMELNSVKKRRIKGESHVTSLLDGKKFNSNYPYFRVALQPTYVRTRYCNVPKHFVERTGLKPQGKNTELMVSDKSWNMKMSVLPYARLHSGWSTFVKDNALQEEDICFFELTNDEDITFQVTIFRANSS